MKYLLFLLVTLVLAGPAVSQTTQGTLGSGDSQRGEGIYYDATTFQVENPSEVVIRLSSTSFDTFLLVRSPSGQESSNDDFEGEAVSQLDILATEVGTWTVWATSYGGGMEGPYELSVTVGREFELETIEGRLDYKDTIALKGEYYDTVVRELTGDAQYIFELISLGYDGYLVVTSPSGEITRNDDAGSIQVSRVGPISGANGKWTIHVTSAQAAEQGAYDLNIVRIGGK